VTLTEGENGRCRNAAASPRTPWAGGKTIDHELASGRSGVRKTERREHEIADGAVDSTCR
jgi:hypothetical protein